MKVILVCFLHLDELPPMMTAIKVLSEKYEVIYIGKDDKSQKYEQLFGSQVRFINILDDSVKSGIEQYNRVKRAVCRRLYTRCLHNAFRIIADNYVPGDLLWIHHEYTLMNMKPMDIPYYLSMYELHPDLFRAGSDLIRRVKTAKRVIVPEYTRSAIVQACCGLNRLPDIIPNKPYEYDAELMRLDDNPISSIVDCAHKDRKKIVVYSGIFLRERKLDTIIEAVQRMKDKFTLVLVGRKSDYLEELIRTYPDVIYLGFYNPPTHLSVIKEADIGILTYVADSGSINPVFCAPNKIWEYAKYGIPMICNDIPGLKFAVEYNKCGFCCDIDSVDSISDALLRIYNDYDELSRNAKQYYHTADVNEAILKTVGEA